MTDKISTDTTPPEQTFTLAQVLDLLKTAKGASAEDIGAAVAVAVAANSGPKKVSFGQYVRKQAEGKSKLARPFYENGQKIPAYQLANSEIDALNQITHSGRYFDRLVEVLVRNENGDESVEVRFDNHVNKMLELKSHFRTTTDMLQQIVALQKQEAAEDEERELEQKTRPGRTFGNSKASREARERLEAGA